MGNSVLFFSTKNISVLDSYDVIPIGRCTSVDVKLICIEKKREKYFPIMHYIKIYKRILPI